VKDYIGDELDVHGLEEIQKFLWIARLKRPTQSFSHQLLVCRDITVTGDADLHLLWYQNRIFIKATSRLSSLPQDLGRVYMQG
jgi:hypothetical protein